LKSFNKVSTSYLYLLIYVQELASSDDTLATSLSIT
jgi:hypothetical protein